jgi:hypothetical protein
MIYVKTYVPIVEISSHLLMLERMNIGKGRVHKIVG